jgi:restriction system protein
VVGGGFSAVADLSATSTTGEVGDLVSAAYSVQLPKAVGSYTNQLFAFVHRIEIGDLIVMPITESSQIAIARVTGPYESHSTEKPDFRRFRPVEWIRTDIPRSAVLQDLLYSTGAFMTICQLTRNDAANRIQAIATTGSDPAATVGMGNERGNKSTGDSITDDLTGTQIDIDQCASD